MTAPNLKIKRKKKMINSYFRSDVNIEVDNNLNRSEVVCENQNIKVVFFNILKKFLLNFCSRVFFYFHETSKPTYIKGF